MPSDSGNFQPIIVIGAARSGTRLLRDSISIHPAVDCVPFDVTFLWHLGNQWIRHDQLDVAMLNPSIERRIRDCLSQFHKGAPFLIEKTVGNCLRVPFVQKVFPRAKFIHLVRNGVDVVESTYRQWLAPPKMKHWIKKLTVIPPAETLIYSAHAFRNTISRLVSARKRKTGVWGVHYVGIEADLQEMDLLEVCAVQWQRCVEMARKGLDCLPEEVVFELRYEDFVRDPNRQLLAIANFCGLPSSFDPATVSELTISCDNIGAGYRRLTTEDVRRVLPYLQETMTSLGYRV